jgi:DNA-binding MarR family transcriptional regulator
MSASGSDVARLADHLAAIGRLLRQSIDSHAQSLPVPLTAPQALAMQLLVEADRDGIELSLSELSERMGLAHSTVSGIVTRLERRDLVRRTTWTHDGRQLRLRLTDSVRHWVDNELPQLRQRPLETVLRQISAKQRAALIDGLAELRELLESESSEADAAGPVESRTTR